MHAARRLHTGRPLMHSSPLLQLSSQYFLPSLRLSIFSFWLFSFLSFPSHRLFTLALMFLSPHVPLFTPLSFYDPYFPVYLSLLSSMPFFHFLFQSLPFFFPRILLPCPPFGFYSPLLPAFSSRLFSYLISSLFLLLLSFSHFLLFIPVLFFILLLIPSSPPHSPLFLFFLLVLSHLLSSFFVSFPPISSQIGS